MIAWLPSPPPPAPQASAVPMLFWDAPARFFQYMPNTRVVMTIHNMDSSGECRQVLCRRRRYCRRCHPLLLLPLLLLPSTSVATTSPALSLIDPWEGQRCC